jgi:plasmid stabilization system protein ParE
VSYRLVVRPDADADILAAETWYNDQQSGLGFDFTRAARAQVRALVSNPLLYPLRHRRLGVRWVFLERFPYKVVYQLKQDMIVVLAVLHAKRGKRAWRQRL